MGISQNRVAKIESGSNISLGILRRYAKSKGSFLVIDFALPTGTLPNRRNRM
jgi:hypothetical protein